MACTSNGCVGCTVILKKFTSQNFQFKIIQPKIFLSSTKIFVGEFFKQFNNIFTHQIQKTA